MSARNPGTSSREGKVTSMNQNSEQGQKPQQSGSEPSDVRQGAGESPARRQLLGTSVYGVGAALFGLAAAACGDDDDDDGNNDGSSGKGGGSPNGGSGGRGGSPQGGSATNGGSSGRGGAPAVAGAGGEGGTGVGPDADITPLNALLTAEYNAIAAYTAGAGLIDEAPDSDALYGLRAEIIAIAVSIQTQHKLHAQALVEAIEGLNGTPVEEADIEFEPPAALVRNPTITNVLKFAASAERGAAVAYNQVLAGLEDAQLRFLASSIEGDESQHFIVLTALVLGLANPGENLTVARAIDVFPQAFVSSVGGFDGLDVAPPDYFP